MQLEARPAPRCLESTIVDFFCDERADPARVGTGKKSAQLCTFAEGRPARVPVMARPLACMPRLRLVPAVAITFFGSVCGPCAGVAPESPPQAAQEAAGDAQAPKPAQHSRQRVRCTECRHAAGNRRRPET